MQRMSANRKRAGLRCRNKTVGPSFGNYSPCRNEQFRIPDVDRRIPGFAARRRNCMTSAATAAKTTPVLRLQKDHATREKKSCFVIFLWRQYFHDRTSQKNTG